MIVVKASIIKSLNERQDKNKLEYFKKELTKVLEQAEKRENNAISKAIEDYDNSMAKTLLDEYGIQKARGYGIGTVREWKGEKYRKIAPGKWRKIYESNTRGAKQSIGIIKKKIMNAKTTDELLQIVMENTNRFMDANGKLLQIEKKMKKAVNESKGKLNEGKPSTQEQIEQFKKENGKSEKDRIADEIKEIDAAYTKTKNIDYDKKDFKTMKELHAKAAELYGTITKNIREAENEGDYSKVGDYENLKDDLHRLLSNIQWRYNEVEKNYIKEQFTDGIEDVDVNNEKVKEWADKFEDEITKFVDNHVESTWSIYSDLFSLIKNQNRTGIQAWLKQHDLNNFDEFQTYIETKVKEKKVEKIKEKNRAIKEAREEKIKNINENNALKTYTTDEINEALKGVLSLMSEREQIINKGKEIRRNEFDARARYDEAMKNHDENRQEVWDEVLKYRKEMNQLAEERDSFEKEIDKFMDPIAYYYLKEFKYKKDEAIDECKTIDEVENLIKSKDWYNEEGNKRLNLKGMEVKGAKEIFKCMERLFAIFPEEKGRKYSMICTPLRRNVWACAGAGEIKFSINYYSNYEDFEASYNATEGNFHPKGTTAKDVVYHEYYHVLTSGIKHRFGLEQRIKQNVTKRLKMRGKKGGPKQDEIIKYGVSEYATTNAAEFGAECFCQALGSENPSAFAIEVFKETLKYKKYMRGMV